MRVRKLFILLLVLFNFALLQKPAQAQLINYGYHEIFFEGITTEAKGYFEFPIENSPLTYVPAIGDSISIHFGAYYWEDEWIFSGCRLYTPMLQHWGILNLGFV